ncbi:DHA2 family efflux MFS transporter permease subunit [Amycolatopsis circi]|uniref:DHA2 family efflux MFS transporter permease subunit n=1 Tax=Amycolatopsis circi TaxID=871959 RepID=UPI001ABF55D5|nr:DHA2 family efflux MFS transporter permease subunit [Amycolatopsis circi]
MRSPNKMLALTLLASAQFMLVVDSSIVNIALPSIQADLKMSAAELSWVVNAYVLVFGGFLLLGGRLADLAGRRRMFMLGLALFTVASLLGGFAQSSGWLYGARAVQGLGAALTSPAALSLLTTTFSEGKERNKALGIWGAAVGAGGACGVLLGGVLTSWLGWEWVLFINVPVGVLAIALAPRLLRESVAEDAAGIDVPGAVFITGSMALLVWGLVDAEKSGWGSTGTIVRLAVAVVLFAAFVVTEKGVKNPLVPFSIFRNWAVTSANVLNILLSMTLLAMFFFIAVYLQEVLGFSALVAGLAYLPLTATIVVSSQLAGKLVGKLGPKWAAVTGLALLTAGLGWFASVRPGGSYAADVLGPSILCGTGMGLSLVAVTIAAMSGTRPQEAGLASGLITTTQQIGGALGLAIIASVAAATTAGFGPGAEHNPQYLTEGFQNGFLLATCVALAAALLSLVLLRPRAGSATPEAEERISPASS